jgi:hypothetical protein
MWHPYGDWTRNWSALDRDCAASTCQDIEWDDRRWNGCAASSLLYDAVTHTYEIPDLAHLFFKWRFDHLGS